MRQSHQIALKSCPLEAPQMVHYSQLLFFFMVLFITWCIPFQDLTDTDYDFPAGAEDADNHEWEEYDEPQPVIPDTSLTEETSGVQGEETDIDYDDPVQRYR